jgi:4-hydroxybenzoate polyprenyltransferase
VSALVARLDAYYRLVRLDRPIGALLLLWPALWSLWFAARGVPHTGVLAIFVAGVFLTRSAGCAVNDFADRDFDPHVERTRNRPLAARRIRPWEAIAVAVVLFGVAFLLVLRLNTLTVLLSFAALAIAVVYPFLKRVFDFPQAWLGLAFGFSIPMAYAAETGTLPAPAWWLLLANIFWSIAYDTEYAMVDREDDLRVGVRSSAILLGRWDVAGVMASQALFLGVMGYVGWDEGLRLPYFLGLTVAVALALYQYTLIRGRERTACFRAFLNNNWLGFAVFAGTAADFYLRVR